MSNPEVKKSMSHALILSGKKRMLSNENPFCRNFAEIIGCVFLNFLCNLIFKVAFQVEVNIFILNCVYT